MDSDMLNKLVMHTVLEQSMVTEPKHTQPKRQGMTAIERLGLRISSLINHPVAQIQRRITFQRLDTEGDQEWDEVMGLLSDTPGITVTFNNDATVTLRWDARTEDDVEIESESLRAIAEPLP